MRQSTVLLENKTRSEWLLLLCLLNISTVLGTHKELCAVYPAFKNLAEERKTTMKRSR